MTSNATIEDRLANYRHRLDDAIDNRPGVASADDAERLDFIDLDSAPPADDGRLGWARIGYLAAALALCVGVAVGVGLVSLNDGSDVAAGPFGAVDAADPVACAGTDPAEFGAPLPVVDTAVPGFIAVLPAGTSVQTLAVRAMVNPRGGDLCLAYDPELTRTSFDAETRTVNLTTGSSSAIGELDIALLIGQTADVVGVIGINGRTNFVVDVPVPVLRFTGGMPDEARIVRIQLQKGSQSWSFDQRIPASNQIPLEVPMGMVDEQPDAPFSSVVFTLLDVDQRAVDVGAIVLDQ